MSYAVKFTGPPYSGGGGVGPMNSSRALSVPPSTALQLGNSLDFTIELWVKNNGVIYNGVDYGADYGADYLNGWNPIISQSVIDEGHGNNTGWVISIQDLKIVLNPWLSYTPNTTTRGRYIHIAVVRRLGTTSLYVNGVSVASSSSVFDMNSAINVRSDTPFIIGGHELVVSTTCYCNISNVRVLKGVAAYIGNFTPPTKNLATSGAVSAGCYASTTNVNTSFAASYCSLLTCQDSTIKDNALNATITNYGATVVAY